MLVSGSHNPRSGAVVGSACPSPSTDDELATILALVVVSDHDLRMIVDEPLLDRGGRGRGR